MKTGNQDGSEKHETRLVREAVVIGDANPLLSTTETSIQKELTPEFEEQMHEREEYGGNRLNENIYRQYGMLRRSKIREVFSDAWLECEAMEAGLGDLVNMLVAISYDVEMISVSASK